MSVNTLSPNDIKKEKDDPESSTYATEKPTNNISTKEEQVSDNESSKVTSTTTDNETKSILTSPVKSIQCKRLGRFFK